MLSLAHSGQYYQILLAQGMLRTRASSSLSSPGVGCGLALGLIFVPSVGVVSHHFRARKTFAMGIVISGARCLNAPTALFSPRASVGSSCGGIVFPILLNHLIPRIGFAWTVRTTAFIVLALMALGTIIMRPHFPVLDNVIGRSGDSAPVIVNHDVDKEKSSVEPPAHVREKRGDFFQFKPSTVFAFRTLLLDHSYWLSVAA